LTPLNRLSIRFCSRNAEDAKGAASGPVAVTSTVAETGDIGVYLNAIGTVTPVFTDSIASQVTGVIKAVYYNEGQAVHKSD
jgi:membrane fusion protein, multidrug efflux system